MPDANQLMGILPYKVESDQIYLVVSSLSMTQKCKVSYKIQKFYSLYCFTQYCDIEETCKKKSF